MIGGEEFAGEPEKGLWAQYERGGDSELTKGDFDDGERAEMM